MKFDFSYADVAFKNGKVILVDDKDGLAEAVAVKGNKIVFAGTNSNLLKITDEKTTIIDLAGRTLMPGIIDTHYHPILAGLIEKRLGASIIDTFYWNCKSLSEMLKMIKDAAALKKPGEWISMMGYEPTLFPERRHPTIYELDAAAPNNPVHCMHGGGHICVYNSKALSYIDVREARDAEKYPADEVEVENGNLTGMVRGNTHFKLWEKVGYAQEQQAAAAMRSHKHLLESGITSICDCGECGAPSFHIMQKIVKEGAFKVRVSMMLHSIFGKSFSKEIVDNWLKLRLLSGLGDERFRIGACKFMIDGGSGAPSCATREPYSHNAGLPREKGWEREEAASYIKMINDAECQATAHAIGDLAIEFMVEGYEKAFADNPRPDLRHRIEHCTIVDKDLVNRMGKINICPSVNISSIQKMGSKFADFYGKERNRYICALRSMLDAGVVCSLHSDTPSYPAGLATIDAAVNRYDRVANVQCDRTQAISVLEAVRCATINGAYATHEESVKGSIEPGKLADMIVLSDDILAVDPMEIHNLKVDMTMIDGRIEYERMEK
jgi:predicted amidohydrolase YtcJ